MEAFFIRLVTAHPRMRPKVWPTKSPARRTRPDGHGAGSLVVTLPREAKKRLAAHSLVALIGGVTLNHEGAATEALRQRFAANAARQLAYPELRPDPGSNELDPHTAGQVGRLPVASVRPEPERSPT